MLFWHTFLTLLKYVSQMKIFTENVNVVKPFTKYKWNKKEAKPAGHLLKLQYNKSQYIINKQVETQSEALVKYLNPKIKMLALKIVCCRLMVVVNAVTWFTTIQWINSALFPTVKFYVFFLSFLRERFKFPKNSIENMFTIYKVFVRMNGQYYIKFAR